ncbi:uncharacterized protein H6S33_008937 [Morchella sextelata]|uniref:uncharacterized protein n=1 Tax=Morchella sextelata TaxID=1174677 RepID=UPI001D03A538|nr:uncharacterized protein H6S33_008937 [Morchella sextelata]KAH0612557.1 hypothetical protein H6S33_008937 [Morchella sextelata]
MASWSPTISPDAVSENWSTVLLSLRDLRRDVPINYNQYPGIALTPACFADGSYTDDKAACVADLIAIGYRSFLLDLYLDGESGGWGICPASDVPAPAASSNAASSTTPTTTPASTTAAASLLPRQSAQSYTCTPSFNATTLLTIFDTWMTGTNTDLGARILLLTLSLHPTRNTTSTTPPQPLTSTLKSANILADAYTPTLLLSDRNNLNGSWYDDTTTTNNTYFTTRFAADNTVSTPDGWPSESYLEFKVGKRVLVAFGELDNAVSAVYDPAATGDDAVIFPEGYIGEPVPYNASSTPTCFYNPSDTRIAAGNSSWAQALYRAPAAAAAAAAANITALINCGYSTLLDSVGAANTSLEERFRSYEAQIRATAAWAWGDDEPQNTTGRKASFRCAAMRVADGRWFVADCNESRRAACRVGGRPYDWTLTPTPLPYALLPPCFAAPRTPLENTHLHSLLRSTLPSTASVWLDLNSLSTDSCWVSGGANAPCPYKLGDEGRREVIVSAVAAVIVLVVFGLMWFAKGASWRVERSRRKRRRAVKKRVREGVEYEGVPS